MNTENNQDQSEADALFKQMIEPPLGSILDGYPGTEPPNNAMSYLAAGFDKYGHRFARKKRQMKKNRRRYGMCWKINQICKIIGRARPDSPTWAFIGNDKLLWAVDPAWNDDLGGQPGANSVLTHRYIMKVQ